MRSCASCAGRAASLPCARSLPSPTACPSWGCRRVGPTRYVPLLRLFGLRCRPADDARHVGAVLFLLLEEGLVVGAGGRLLFAFDRRERLLGLGLRSILWLHALDRIHGLLDRLACGLLGRGHGRSCGGRHG